MADKKAWTVTITETLSRTVSVEAGDGLAAEEIIRAKYERGEIRLDEADRADTEIACEQEGICPLCGTEVEYSGENRIDDDGGTFPWHCPSCGAYGKESYNRKFAGHIDVDTDEDAQG